MQVNGASILDNGVANVPIMTQSTPGVATVSNGVYGIRLWNNTTSPMLVISAASNNDVKAPSGSTMTFKPIVASQTDLASFYGLAKAAGDTTQSQSANTVGNYTDTAKEKIQSMLGITQMLAPENPNLVASQTYSIGDVFAANGHLYKATVAIA